MLFSRLLPVLAFASSTVAQNDEDATVLTGTVGSGTRTAASGTYISYETTITRSTLTAITTSEILSYITGESGTRTRTVGTTTIFGLNGTPVLAANSSGTRTGTTTKSPSQLILEGSTRTTLSNNGTSNATTSATSTSIQPINTTPCNNYVEFCNRSYGNITEVAAHNSPFVRAGNAAANQQLDVVNQLNDGVRLLQGQMHFVNGTPHFCHGSCDVLDAGPITDYLGKVYNWILTHPFDVVTLLLGNALGADGLYPLLEPYIPFLEETGLKQFAYEPPVIPMALNDWPTLGSMILSGKRVVIFMDYMADQTAHPWILDEFSQVWETPFDPTDRDFPCTVQRPPDLPEDQAKNRLYLFNHNLNYEINLLGIQLLVPQVPLLNITNNVTGFGSLGVNTGSCTETWGFPPKFLNVDYYNVGDGSVFEVAAQFNNVTYTRECCGLVGSNDGLRIKGANSLLLVVLVGSVGLLML